MLITIVIPNLHSPTVHKTIHALLNQTVNPSMYEVIIVGMDKWGLIADSGSVHFDQTEKPISQAAARNRGAFSAKGDILVFVDADCIPYSDWLEVIIGRFSDPSISVLGGGVTFSDKNYWKLADNIATFHEYLSNLPPGTKQQLPGLNLAIRRSAFEQSGGFDQNRPAGEDSDLTIRLRRLGFPLFFEPRAVVLHDPSRHQFLDLLQHAYHLGKHSVKVDPVHASDTGLPWFFRTRLGMIISAPLLATGITFRIFLKNSLLLKYWYTAPAILASKLAWCVGASMHP